MSKITSQIIQTYAYKLFDFNNIRITTRPLSYENLFKQTCNFGCLCLLSSKNDFCTETCCFRLLDKFPSYVNAFEYLKSIRYNIIEEKPTSTEIIVNLLNDIKLNSAINIHHIVWLLMYYYLKVLQVLIWKEKLRWP